jgi:CDP-glucose 4,6-dehydratase
VDRLIPDIIRALEAGNKIELRRPDAVRPWQHVLDCVYGYLLVAAGLLEGRQLAPAYNFASSDGDVATVLDVATLGVGAWDASPDVIVVERDDSSAEAATLRLDASLARRDLAWTPAFSLEEAIAETVRFYRDSSIGREQIGTRARSARE